MKKLGCLAIAALFSVASFAQVNTEQRDLEQRTPPTLEQKEKKDVEMRSAPTLEEKKDVELKSAPTLEQKDRSATESKADVDFKNKEVISTETTVKTDKKNSICCGKEKNDGFLNKLRKNDVKDSGVKTKTKTKTETKKVESSLDESSLNKSEMEKSEVQKSEIEGQNLKMDAEIDQSKTEVDPAVSGVTGGAIDEESTLDAGVSTDSDIYNHDTRMDAGGRGHLDLETESPELDSGVETDKNLELKDSGSRCPSSDMDVEDDSNLQDSDSRMNEDVTSPKF